MLLQIAIRHVCALRRAADHRQHLRRFPLERRPIVGLDVESQQWLGVRRAQIEPPVREAHGHAVEVVDLGSVSP